MMIDCMLAGLRRSVHSRVNDCFERRLGKKLKLDDEQQAKLARPHVSVKKARAGVSEIRHECHRVIGEMLIADDFDRDMALRIMKAPTRPFDKSTGSLVDYFNQFFVSLDHVQRKRLQLLWQKYRFQLTRRWH